MSLNVRPVSPKSLLGRLIARQSMSHRGSPRQASPRLRCERLEDRTVPTFTSIGAAIDMHVVAYGMFDGVTRFDDEEGQTGSISPGFNNSYNPSGFYSLDPLHTFPNDVSANATAAIQSTWTPTADVQSGQVTITTTAGWGWSVTFPHFADASAHASVTWSYDFASDTPFTFTAQVSGRAPAISLLNISNPNAIGPANPVNGALPSGAYRIVISKSNDILAGQGGADWSIRPVQTTPVVTVTASGGTYNGSPYPATATVNGGALLEGVGLTLDYVRHEPDGSTTDLGSAAPSNAGNYTVTAVFPGSPSYTSAQAATDFTVAKADQTITVTTDAPTKAVYGSTFPVEAIASSGLKVQITVDGPAIPSQDPDNPNRVLVKMTGGTGTVRVFFSQGGDTNYNAAPDVSEQVTAQTYTPTIVVAPYSVTFDGRPHAATIKKAIGLNGKDLSALIDVSHTVHTSAGDNPLDFWSFNDPDGNYTNVFIATIDDYIAKANPDYSVSPYAVTYDGKPHTAVVTVTGVDQYDGPQKLDHRLSYSRTHEEG
jgi:hypothetical protein